MFLVRPYKGAELGIVCRPQQHHPNFFRSLSNILVETKSCQVVNLQPIATVVTSLGISAVSSETAQWHILARS